MHTMRPMTPQTLSRKSSDPEMAKYGPQYIRGFRIVHANGNATKGKQLNYLRAGSQEGHGHGLGCCQCLPNSWLLWLLTALLPGEVDGLVPLQVDSHHDGADTLLMANIFYDHALRCCLWRGTTERGVSAAIRARNLTPASAREGLRHPSHKSFHDPLVKRHVLLSVHQKRT